MDKENKCRHFFSGCVSVSDDKTIDYYSISGNSFEKIKTKGKVPLAVDMQRDLYVLKGMDEDGISIEIRKNDTVKKLEFGQETSSVLSACFLDDGSLAMLQLDEEGSVERSYIVSISDVNYSELTGFKVIEENTRDLFNRLFSLGAVIERPAAVQCYGQNVYIISHRIFSDMMNVVVYKLDRSEKKLEYITGYYPVNTGKVSIHFQEKDSILYIYTGNRLVTVKGLGSPVERVFNEPGEILFYSESIISGTYLYFIPDNKAPGESEIRKILL